MRHINSLTNTTVKALRALHERKYRQQSGLFLAEGMRIVMEALIWGGHQSIWRFLMAGRMIRLLRH